MSKSFDFHVWAEKVKQFHRGLKKLPGVVKLDFKARPRLSGKSLTKLDKKWPRGVPAVLRSMWTTGCSGIQCFYMWEPPNQVWRTLYGGIDFYPASYLFPGNSGASLDDEDAQEVVGMRGHDYWCRCAIFHNFGNGDSLGFDLKDNPDDPAVVYLVHDDKTSKQISPTLTEFLEKWTKAAFLWPNNWGYGVWPFRMTKSQKAEVAELLELVANLGF